MKNLSYRNDVDGLRALSVLAVLFYHLEIFNISGGFLGVDIFFVISGYIITRLIIKEYNLKKFQLSNFYWRRIRRIFPPLILTLLFTNLISLFLFFPNEYDYLSRANLSVIFFISNFFFWKNTDYFDELTSQSPLLHTWSLSVEEQFYIIFPILFIFFYKLKNKNLFFYFVLIISILSLVSANYLGKISSDPNFFFTTSRVFEIGLGILTALVERNNFFTKFKNKILNNFYLDFLNLFFLTVLILSFFYLNERMNLPNYYTLIPVLSCSYIILFNHQKSLISKILSNKFSSLTGKISYGMYLYHFPIIIFFNYFGLDKFKSLLIFVIFFISYISWKYFETPFRNNSIISKKFFTICIMGAVLIFTLNLVNRETIKNYLSFSIPLEYQKIMDQTKKESEIILDDNDCRIIQPIKTIDKISFLERVEICKKKYGDFLYLAGGSHVQDLYNSIYLNLPKEKFVVANISGSCAMYFNNESCDYDKVLNFIKDNKDNIKFFFYTQIGSDYLKNFYGPEVETKYVSLIVSFLKKIKQNNIDVIWFGPQPQPEIEMNYKFIRSMQANNFNLFSLKHVDKVDQYMKKIARESDIKFISKIETTKYDPKKDYLVENKITYSDSDHWSFFGEKYFGEQIFNSKIFNDYYYK
jgi:peptidoglycan/LPS O-acetylase OafA/YrhL